MLPTLRSAYLLLLAAVPFAASAQTDSAPASPATTVRIDPSANHGVWEGWGVSLAWWAKVFGDRDDIADWLYTTRDSVTIGDNTVPGLGMTIARYNAGACSDAEFDGRRMIVSKTILPFRQIDAFWLDGKNPDPDSASWDWSVDANQRAMLQKARDRGANRFELFSNSPPWWMCANDNPSGSNKDSVENLPIARRPEFAHYLATIARRAKDHWGITFTTVAAFNEPSASYWFANGKQEGSHFPPSSQAEIIPLVRAALDAQGLSDLEISSSDETSYDHAVTAWKTYPPEVKALVAQVNVHGYQGEGGDRAGLHRMVVTENGKRLWNSEYGDRFGDGIHMVRNFHRDMAALRPTAWVYWQAIDGGINGTGGSGWGLMDGDLLKGEPVKATAKAYLFAQYSRHIRPGMTILSGDDPTTVIAHDPATRRLVIASFNGDDAARTFTYDLSRFRSVNGAKAASWLTEPLGTARYQRRADETVRTNSPSWTIPAKAVLTIQIDGVSL